MAEYEDDDGGLWDAGGDEEMAEGARNLYCYDFYPRLWLLLLVFEQTINLTNLSF